MADQSPILRFHGKYTRVDPYVFTCTPTLAPRQRRINRRQPKQGRGLNRNSKRPMPQSTRRSISLPEYFLAWRFAAMSRGMGWGAGGAVRRWDSASVRQGEGLVIRDHASEQAPDLLQLGGERTAGCAVYVIARRGGHQPMTSLLQLPVRIR